MTKFNIITKNGQFQVESVGADAGDLINVHNVLLSMEKFLRDKTPPTHDLIVSMAIEWIERSNGDGD